VLQVVATSIVTCAHNINNLNPNVKYGLSKS
jgi:hypothetical protein